MMVPDTSCRHVLRVAAAAMPWPVTYRDIGLGSTSTARVHVVHLERLGLVHARRGRPGILLTSAGAAAAAQL
jgi:hypothetical protein